MVTGKLTGNREFPCSHKLVSTGKRSFSGKSTHNHTDFVEPDPTEASLRTLDAANLLATSGMDLEQVHRWTGANPEWRLREAIGVDSFSDLLSFPGTGWQMVDAVIAMLGQLRVEHGVIPRWYCINLTYRTTDSPDSWALLLEVLDLPNGQYRAELTLDRVEVPHTPSRTLAVTDSDGRVLGYETIP